MVRDTGSNPVTADALSPRCCQVCTPIIQSFNKGTSMPLEHLTNCHGEWNAAIALVASVPLIGLWLKLKISQFKTKEQ